jgi:hypothetical protein
LEADRQELTNSPRHLGQLRIAAVAGPLTLGIEGIHTGRRLTIGGGSTPGATLTNLTLSAPGFSRRLRASLSLQNVFNARLFDPAGEEHHQPVIRQDGRSARARITWAF